MAKKKRKSYKKYKKKSPSFPIFTIFILVALAVVVILEYMDFKKGKESFLFNKVLQVDKAPEKERDFNNKLIALLEKEKLSHDYFRDEHGVYHFKLDISREEHGALVERIKALAVELAGKLELSEIQRKNDRSVMLYQVSLGKVVSHVILITRLEKIKIKTETEKPVKTERKKTPKKTGGAPRLAIIIDDVGEYGIGALELKQLNIPITASILPDSPRAAQEARWVNEYGLRAMIHLPMQPRNSNGSNYGPGKVITRNSSSAEIEELVRRARQIVPNAEGINNHEGSLATADRPTMSRVMKIVKREGLFFVDSRTIGSTVAYDVAMEMGIPAARKDAFLDHNHSYDSSMKQIKELVRIALQKGQAIGIGHPRESTMQAIRDSVDYIKSRGIEIVFVNELLD